MKHRQAASPPNQIQGFDSSNDEKAVIDEAIKRREDAHAAWSKNHELAREDNKFRNGDHWPEAEKERRKRENRPMLTFNTTESYIKQAVNQAKMSRVAMDVIPVDVDIGTDDMVIPNIAGNKDYKLSMVYDSLIRQIEYMSRADDAYDTALDHAAGNGFGWFRIITQYTDWGFDKEIRICRVRNPFSITIDMSDPGVVGENANYGFVNSFLPPKVFEKLYKEPLDSQVFTNIGESQELWWDGDRVCVSEYFRRVPVERKIVRTDQGRIFDLGTDKSQWDRALQFLERRGAQIDAARTIESHKVEWRLVTGHRVLEGPIEFPSSYIPLILVPGDELVLDGETIYRSLHRFAQDAMRNYNYWRTTATETVALSSKAPWTAGKNAIAGYEGVWKEANIQNFGVLPWNDDNPQTQAPKREAPPQIPTGAVEEARASEFDVKSTIGLFSPNLGAPSNERSGVLFEKRKKQGDVGIFTFPDNLAKAIAHGARIMVEMIPRIYDNERMVRIRSPKGEMDAVKINVRDPLTGKRYFDIGSAKFDVMVKAGGDYNSQREEIVDLISTILQGKPEEFSKIADVFLANLDNPAAEALAKRYYAMLPPEIRQADGMDEKQLQQQQIITPEMVQQAVQQAVEQERERGKNASDMMDSETKRFDSLTKRMEALAGILEDQEANEERIRETVARSMAEFFMQMHQAQSLGGQQTGPPQA